MRLIYSILLLLRSPVMARDSNYGPKPVPSFSITHFSNSTVQNATATGSTNPTEVILGPPATPVHVNISSEGVLPTSLYPSVYKSEISAYPTGSNPNYTAPPVADINFDEPVSLLSFYSHPFCPGGSGGEMLPVSNSSFAGESGTGLPCATKEGKVQGTPIDLEGNAYLTIHNNLTANCQFHWYNSSTCGDAHWLGYMTAPMQRPHCMNLTDTDGNSLRDIIRGFSYVCA